MQQVSTMSRRLVALTTLCSHIRQSSKLTLARAFHAMSANRDISTALSTAQFANNDISMSKNVQQEEELKLTRMVKVLEGVQSRRNEIRIAFKSFSRNVAAN